MGRRVIIPRNMNSSDETCYLWNEIEIHTCVLRLSFFGFFIKKNLASRNIVPYETRESLSFLFFKNKSTSVAFRRKRILKKNRQIRIKKNEFRPISSLLLLHLLLSCCVHSLEAKKLRIGLVSSRRYTN